MSSENSNLPELPNSWVWVPLAEVIKKIPLTGRKLLRREYKDKGQLPVIDQGQTFVGGYTDEVALVAPCLPPIIVFGDHTKVIKYVDFDFVAGADGIKVIKPLEVFYPKLLYYFLQIVPLPDKGYARHFQFLEKSIIPLPPLPEQHRIIYKIEELFTKLDAGVEALNKIKLQLKQYRQAVLKHAFEGKLTEEWREAHKSEVEPASVLLEKIKAERAKRAKGKVKELLPTYIAKLPKLPQGWVWTTLHTCSAEIYRYPTFYGMEHLDTGVPVIRGEHINNDGTISHDWTDYWFVSEQLSRKFPRTVVDTGDLIMSVRGSVGKMGLADDALRGAQVSPNCLRISLLKKYCLPKLVLFYLKSLYGQGLIKQMISATTIGTIKAGLFVQINIPLPPLTEQYRLIEEIERHFSVADEIEKVVGQSLKQAERLRQSILKRAFEGKLVPQDPTDEPAERLLERIKAEKSKRYVEKKARGKSRNKLNTIQRRLIYYDK